jgi:hypothetical protein
MTQTETPAELRAEERERERGVDDSMSMLREATPLRGPRCAPVSYLASQMDMHVQPRHQHCQLPLFVHGDVGPIQTGGHKQRGAGNSGPVRLYWTQPYVEEPPTKPNWQIKQSSLEFLILFLD